MQLIGLSKIKCIFIFCYYSSLRVYINQIIVSNIFKISFNILRELYLLQTNSILYNWQNQILYASQNCVTIIKRD